MVKERVWLSMMLSLLTVEIFIKTVSCALRSDEAIGILQGSIILPPDVDKEKLPERFMKG